MAILRADQPEIKTFFDISGIGPTWAEHEHSKPKPR